MKNNIDISEVISHEKLGKEFDQLKSMGKDDAVELVKGYHKMILNKLSESMELIQKVSDMSPATIALTDTALIVAETDIIAKKSGDKIHICGCVGSNEQLADLLLNVLERLPSDVTDKILKEKGYAVA